jgi:hypothetical protein
MGAMSLLKLTVEGSAALRLANETRNKPMMGLHSSRWNI